MNRFAIFYIGSLHVLVVAMLWKSDFLHRVSKRIGWVAETPQSEITDFYNRILLYHRRSIDLVPDDSIIFIGNSITQGLCVTAVHPSAVNYGIGGDTTKGVLNRIPSYAPALQRAKCIIIAIGINDIRYRSADEAIQNYATILDRLPKKPHVFVSGILPTNENGHETHDVQLRWINEFNAQLRRLAAERDRVEFIDSSRALDTDGDNRLDARFDDGDGVHLNSMGNQVWATVLRNAIQRVDSVD